MSFAIFDEKFYLENNPDVQAAVAAGAFKSGLQHFEQHGLAEGRNLVSVIYNENLYLQKYPDVAKAVVDGAFSSGLQHYIQHGQAEGRSPGAFDDNLYLLDNPDLLRAPDRPVPVVPDLDQIGDPYQAPDVSEAVAMETFSLGLQHYLQYGQFEENRTGYFSGSSESDTVAVSGVGNNVIAGVPLTDILITGQATTSVDEVDTLIGGAGSDQFILGVSGVPPIIPTSQLYVGGGAADHARIQNFEQSKDVIFLPGFQQDYSFQTVNGNFEISTAYGDLIGVVMGVPSLSQIPFNFLNYADSDSLSDLPASPIDIGRSLSFIVLG